MVFKSSIPGALGKDQLYIYIVSTPYPCKGHLNKFSQVTVLLWNTAEYIKSSPNQTPVSYSYKDYVLVRHETGEVENALSSRNTMGLGVKDTKDLMEGRHTSNYSYRRLPINFHGLCGVTGECRVNRISDKNGRVPLQVKREPDKQR